MNAQRTQWVRTSAQVRLGPLLRLQARGHAKESDRRLHSEFLIGGNEDPVCEEVLRANGVSLACIDDSTT